MRRKRDSDVVKDGERIHVGMMFRDEDGLPGRVFLDADGTKVEAMDWQASYVRDCKVAHALGLEDGEALHRPGFRFCDVAGNEAKAKALLQSIEDAENAWREPPAGSIAERAPGLPRHEPFSAVTGAGESGGRNAPSGYSLTGQREGDICTVRDGGVDEGAPGHLRMVGGELRCVAVREQEGEREDGRDERARAYDQMCRELSDAWRGK